MQQTQAEPEIRLSAAARVCAAAEHGLWVEMLDYSERLVTEYGAIEEYFARQATLLSIPLEIGVAMNLSEGQVRRVLSAAERIRDRAPAVWSAFADGVIDARRAHLISDAIGRLKRDASITKLNLKAVGYAANHTSIELKSWLKKFVARTEADLFNERAESERSQRRVDIEHGDDAMSWLNAYLPSHVAAAIDKRLTLEARKINDDRTLAQRRADLLASWLTTNEHGEIALGADIAVIIGAETLLGHDEEPAVAADGSFVVPARWVLDSATNPFWHSILTGKGGNVLEHRYHGRFAPDILKKALIFTYGVCQAPTCTTPADRCQFDHRQPWPHGPTTGANMWPLCERHHTMKSHRVITWTMASGRTIDAEPVQHRPRSTRHRLRADFVSRLENELACFIDLVA